MSEPAKRKSFLEKADYEDEVEKEAQGKLRGRKISDETKEDSHLKPVLKKMKEVNQEGSTSSLLTRKAVESKTPLAKETPAAAVARCFGKDLKKLTKLINDDGLFLTLSNLATERLMTPITLVREEIFQINELFFKTECSKESLACLNHPQNPMKPEPAYVFYNLFQCIMTISEEGGFEKAKEAAKQLVAKKPDPKNFEHQKASKFPTLPQYLNLGPNQKKYWEEQYQLCLKSPNEKVQEFGKSFLGALEAYIEAINVYRQSLKNLSLVETKDIFESSLNTNQTYLLQTKCKWIFKPFGGNHHHENVPKAEWCASLVNFHHKFPIPLTLSIELDKHVEGSLQLFVEQSIDLEALNLEKGVVHKKRLKRIILFDLLFANEDRNTDNFLFKKFENVFKLFGIDHDQCMMLSPCEGNFRKEYLDLLSEEDLFPEEMLTILVSKESVRHYAEIMRKFKVPPEGIKWMQYAANFIRSNKGMQIKALFMKIQKAYNVFVTQREF